jgi:group I intron endonuclease
MTCRFAIYCHTNKVNGKRYIGQTTGTMAKRWGEHVTSAKGNSGCRILGAAIRKYGSEAFDHEVVEVVFGSQKEADDAEARWISKLKTRSPDGYNLSSGGGGNGRHHDDSKRLIGEASKENWRRMTPEQQANKVERLQSNPEKRLARIRETNSTDEFREKVRSGQKGFWAQLTPEEKTRRVLHQQAGMSDEEKSDRVRRAWAGMAPEDREARIRKAAASASVSKSNPSHSEKMREFQIAQEKLRTPEQRKQMVLKSWESRRAKYGDRGHAKSSEAFSDATRRGWANMSPEARAERARKMQEGKLRALSQRNSRLIRINLLPPSLLQ